MGGRLTTAILVVCVAALTVVAVRREFRVVGRGRSPRPLLLVEPRWRDALGVGSWVGDSAAPIVLLEFVDLQCPGCRAMHPVLKELRNRFGQRLSEVFVNYPIQYHPRAFEAARAAECAVRSDAFEMFLDAAFARPELVDSGGWSALASDAGIRDREAFANCLRDSVSAKLVAGDVEAGRSLSVDATPTVIVNGLRFQHPPSEAYLVSVVQDLLDGRIPEHKGDAGAVALPDSGQAALETRFDSSMLLQGATVTIGSDPIVAYGGSSTPAEFDLTRVGRVALRSDSSLAVLAPHDQRILIFDQSGRPVRRIGGRGQAPSELQGAEDFVVLPGDTLLVLDLGNRKWVWFDPEGRYVRSVQLPDTFPNALGRIAGRLDDGRFALNSMELLRLPDTDAATRLPISVELASTGGQREHLFDVPGPAVARMVTNYRGRQGIRPVPVRFGPRTQVVVWNGSIAVATGDRPSVSIYDTRGTQRRRIEFPFRRKAVTRKMREAEATAEWERLRRPGTEPLLDPKETERQIRETPTADSLPTISDLIVGVDKRLWVVEASPPEQKGWSAVGLNPDGSLAGQVTSASAGEPTMFGADFVIVSETDADGVRSFKRYPFHLRH